MNIYQDCILELFETNGFSPIYVDVHQIGSVSYYFENGIVLKFEKSCIPEDMANWYLSKFQLEDRISQIQGRECECIW